MYAKLYRHTFLNLKSSSLQLFTATSQVLNHPEVPLPVLILPLLWNLLHQLHYLPHFLQIGPALLNLVDQLLDLVLVGNDHIFLPLLEDVLDLVLLTALTILSHLILECSGGFFVAFMKNYFVGPEHVSE